MRYSILSLFIAAAVTLAWHLELNRIEQEAASVSHVVSLH